MPRQQLDVLEPTNPPRKPTRTPDSPWKLFFTADESDAADQMLGQKGGKRAHRLKKSLEQIAMKAIAPLYVMGLSQHKIGETLGLTPQQVRRLVELPAFAPIVDEYRLNMYTAAEQALTSAQPFAIWTLFRLLSAKSEYVQEKAAADLLANGKILERIQATKPGDEQRELLRKAAENADKPRVAMTVIINNGRISVRKKKADPLMIDAEAKAIEAPDEDVDDEEVEGVDETAHNDESESG